MIFTLEALQAFHGDSLLVHAGEPGEPVLVLIDGGPSRTWETSLRPRLEALRTARAGDGGALRVDLAIVSHIDDDHVHGMLDMAGELVALKLDSRPLPYDVRTLWHNAFDDVVDDAEAVRAAAAAALARPLGDPRADEIRAAGLAVVASVGQGRELRDHAETLGWSVNAPFHGPVSQPAGGGARTISLGPLKLTVVAPLGAQLERLREAWDEWLVKHGEAVRGEAAPAAFTDSSPYNLSSIVVLAECGGRTMLLTGDARGDHVLEALDRAGLADGGVTRVDVLKLPHHGSIRNLADEFFERVVAEHYVISADGRHGNPEDETLSTLARVRSDDDFQLHLTNREGHDGLGARLSAFLAAEGEAGRGYGVRFRADADPSLRIDLLDALSG